MRIIYITPDFPPRCGGLGHYAAYLAEELLRGGHDVSILFRGRLERTYTYKQMPVTEFKVLGIPPLNVKLLQNRIENTLNIKNFDLVHIHYGAMPAINCKKPVIVTAHFCNKEGIHACHRPIKSIDSLYRNFMFPIYTWIEARQASSCDKLTVVSESLKREYQKHYNIKADVIYNGVDTSLFHSCKNNKKEDAILYTGRLDSGKGLLDLLEIARLLIKKNKKIRIYIIGDGPLRTRIISLLREKSLSNVTLVNNLSHEQLIKYYHKAKIYVMPSYHEGLPNTVLEAMACELPVVATNVGGIPEQIDEGESGYMLMPGNIQGFYNRIVELLDDRDKQRKFGEMGRRKVLEKFTWSHVSSRVEKIYNEILRR